MLTAMAERRVSEIVSQAQGFGEILVQPKGASDRPPDLRNFNAVGEPDSVVIAIGRDEHLRLVAQSTEGDGVNDPVAVALKDVARSTRAGCKFGMKPPARVCGPGGERA